jgi:hypothetical protein
MNAKQSVTVKHQWAAAPSRYVITIEQRSYLTWIEGQERARRMLTWRGVLGRLCRWLMEVKNDLETPDLWADWQRQAGLLQATSEDITENAPFTSAEQTDIAARLPEWADHAQRAHSLSSAQTQVLVQKVQYLTEAARHMGRKDWLNVCTGTIFGNTLTASLPPEAAREIFFSVSRAVGHLFGLPMLPL